MLQFRESVMANCRENIKMILLILEGSKKHYLNVGANEIGGIRCSFRPILEYLVKKVYVPEIMNLVSSSGNFSMI